MFIPVLFQYTAVALSELMEESEKQIKISPGLGPSSPLCLTPYHLFANFSIIIFLFMLVCLYTYFFLSAPSLWRCRFLANTTLFSITSPHMPETCRDKIKSVLFTSGHGCQSWKKTVFFFQKSFKGIVWHFGKYNFFPRVRRSGLVPGGY